NLYHDPGRPGGLQPGDRLYDVCRNVPGWSGGLRLGRSGDPAGANYPGHALQHPALPYRGGDTMTTGIAEREGLESQPKELASVRARLSALLKRGALHLTLLLITLIWLVPTVGL